MEKYSTIYSFYEYARSFICSKYRLILFCLPLCEQMKSHVAPVINKLTEWQSEMYFTWTVRMFYWDIRSPMS